MQQHITGQLLQLVVGPTPTVRNGAGPWQRCHYAVNKTSRSVAECPSRNEPKPVIGEPISKKIILPSMNSLGSFRPVENIIGRN